MDGQRRNADEGGGGGGEKSAREGSLRDPVGTPSAKLVDGGANNGPFLSSSDEAGPSHIDSGPAGAKADDILEHRETGPGPEQEIEAGFREISLERNTREPRAHPDGKSNDSDDNSRADHSFFRREAMPIGYEDIPDPIGADPLAKYKEPVEEARRAREALLPTRRIMTIGPWRLLRTIGHGATSKVKLAVHRETGERRAVKLVSRKKFHEQFRHTQKQQQKGARRPPESVAAKEQRVLREASILYLLDHQNILPLLDMLVTPSHYVMFFEHVEGVRMLDFIQCHRALPERIARKFFRQLLAAVDFLHCRGIVHRDLKIENVMVETPSGVLKLIDFGLSNFYCDQPTVPGLGTGLLTTYCGSLYFAAPELLHGRPYRGPEIDVWSLGVILFVMATGRVPFDDPNVARLHEKIKMGAVDYPAGLSRPLRTLLQRMLVVDPYRRATVTELMNHPWVVGGGGRLEYTSLLPGPRIGSLDERVVEQVCWLFGYEFDRHVILQALHAAMTDWPRNVRNPICLLYMMIAEKLAQESLSANRSMPNLTGGTGQQVRRSVSVGEQRRAERHAHGGADEPDRDWERTVLEHSHNPPGPSASPLASRDMFPLAAPTLKHIISPMATSFKPTAELRRDIIAALEEAGFRFEDRLTHFCIEWRRLDGRTGGIGPAGLDKLVRLELHLILMHAVGMHWLQFQRICGDVTIYKALCASILSALKL